MIYAFFAVSLLSAFVLPQGTQIQYIMKYISNYWIGVMLYSLMFIFLSDVILFILKKKNIRLPFKYPLDVYKRQQYTRPVEFMGKKVPDVLLSGHHANVDKWRREQSVIRTFNKRPELLENAQLSKSEIELINKLKNNG